MEFQEKMDACIKFFNELCHTLEDGYEVVSSCNHDISAYLVPKGTADQISYWGKPKLSFRVSDHWNWFANLKKCPNPNYIQCLSVDLPWAKNRHKEGGPSTPVHAAQVAMVGLDGKYHVIFGEKFDRKTRTWSWVACDPKTFTVEI